MDDEFNIKTCRRCFIYEHLLNINTVCCTHCIQGFFWYLQNELTTSTINSQASADTNNHAEDPQQFVDLSCLSLRGSQGTREPPQPREPHANRGTPPKPGMGGNPARHTVEAYLSTLREIIVFKDQDLPWTYLWYLNPTYLGTTGKRKRL